MLLLFLTFALLLLMGVPIAMTMAMSSLAYLFVYSGPNALLSVPQKLYQGTDNFVLIAIPFFLLAGELMNATGLSARLIRFLTVLFGHIRGALAYVNVMCSIVFAGMSGTATADTAAIGGILIPAMKKQGYKAQFAAALTAASATIGPIIPPSMILIMYAVFANVSVAALFAAGFVPGLMLGLIQLAVVYLYARAGKLPAPEKRAGAGDMFKGFTDALLTILLPVIILGGILGGVFTATEAAVVAVVYALFLSGIIYRTLSIDVFGSILKRTALATGNLLFIAAAGLLFAWVLAAEKVPTIAADYILGLTSDPLMFLLFVNLLLLVVGAFMDTIAALIILVPVLYPISQQLGINPVHFGVVICFNLTQGLLTPPLGVVLYICSAIAKVRFDQTVVAVLPFLAANLLILLAITMFPALVLTLPALLGL